MLCFEKKNQKSKHSLSSTNLNCQNQLTDIIVKRSIQFNGLIDVTVFVKSN